MSDRSLKDLAREHKLEQDRQRELNHKYKWALGEGPINRSNLKKRPAKPFTDPYKKHEAEFQQNKIAHMAKMSRKRDPVFDTSDTNTADSSAEEESAAPEPDAGYTYSYDAARGPSKGSHVLGVAIAKALEKFEIKATEKLIKDEYEVIAKEKSDDDDAHTGYAADEDDYELI